jgi:hypothetical protein
MQIYMAAVYSNRFLEGTNFWDRLNEREQQICTTLPYILESYHYVHQQVYVDAMRKAGVQVFLDSGAFSAHTLGVEIKVSDYCDYIHRNLDIIKVEDGALMASVLDGIGDPLQTYRNQLEMEARGVRPLPCFHYGEDERYLEWYVANYDYITIGGMVGKTPAQLMTWLDRIWNKHMVDGAGRPKTKVHAFGITSIPIMEAYPWYSCDSSSWIQMSSFGTVLLPDHGAIKVSDKSPSRHDAGQHVATLTEPETEYIISLFEQAGFTYDRLSTEYLSRRAYNLWAFQQINASINAEKGARYRTHVQELF